MYESQKNRKAVWLPTVTINNLKKINSIASPRKTIELITDNYNQITEIINNEELSIDDAFQMIVDIIK